MHMTGRGAGALVVIGGAEDKEGDQVILKRFVELAGGERSRILVMTVASQKPAEVGALYQDVFAGLGIKHLRVLDVESREEAAAPESIKAVAEATGVFFTGGDQVRITTLLGGSPLDECLHRRHRDGMVIAGTSAGASVMSTTMIERAEPHATASVELVKKGPGLGFMSDVIIDQHFSQRGRVARLISALAEHPGYLGIGIDEDTAVVVQRQRFEVIGAGAVTVVDATNISHTNADEFSADRMLAVCGLQLHILPAGYHFDLRHKQPIIPPAPQGSEREEQ
jgi:cyanophycinase